MIRLAALACGLLCGAGLLISGLYDPALVYDLPERENGPLAFGMALFAIIFVASIIVSMSYERDAPYLGGQDEPLPDWTGWKPIASALVFGLGWGLAGYVPLSALVSAGALSPGAPVFLVAVLFGMVLSDVVTGKRSIGSGDKGSFG